MKKKLIKKEKGITLVALIITIIVLLILAVVSIRAIKDGGILSKTQSAKETYSEAEEKEKIKLAINQAAIDGMGTINKEPLETALTEQFKDDFEFTEETTKHFKVKIKSSGRVYTINKNGGIEAVELGWKNNGDGSFTKGNETVKIGQTYTNDEVKTKLGATDGTYTGEWEVIGIENEKIKLVSINSVATQTIGCDDPNVYKKDESGNITAEVIDEIVDSNGDGDLMLEKAAYSYAHTEETLNKVAQTTTGIASARSVKIEDIYGIIGNLNKSADNGTTYKYYCDDTTNGQVYSSKKNADGTYENGESTGYTVFTYTNENKEIVTIGKVGNAIKKGEVILEDDAVLYDVTEDESQKKALRSLGNNEVYWFASPCKWVGSSSAIFDVQLMLAGYIITTHPDGGMFNSNDKESESSTLGVRAIVFI